MTNAYKKIFEFYGARHQAKKLMEETAELVEALEDYVDSPTSQTISHIIEEIADCTVVINQLAVAYADNTYKLNEEIAAEVTEEGNKDDNAVNAIVLTAACIICSIAHYENTGKDKSELVEYVKQYKVWLHRIRLRIDISGNEVRKVMGAKIDRQLTRMDMNK